MEFRHFPHFDIYNKNFAFFAEKKLGAVAAGETAEEKAEKLTKKLSRRLEGINKARAILDKDLDEHSQKGVDSRLHALARELIEEELRTADPETLKRLAEQVKAKAATNDAIIQALLKGGLYIRIHEYGRQRKIEGNTEAMKRLQQFNNLYKKIFPKHTEFAEVFEKTFEYGLSEIERSAAEKGITGARFGSFIDKYLENTKLLEDRIQNFYFYRDVNDPLLQKITSEIGENLGNVNSLCSAIGIVLRNLTNAPGKDKFRLGREEIPTVPKPSPVRPPGPVTPPSPVTPPGPVAPPTIVSPTVAPPTVAPPTVAPSPVAPPTVAPPPVTPPPVTPPPVTPPPIVSPTVAPPTVAPPTVAPSPVAPPTVAPPAPGDIGHLRDQYARMRRRLTRFIRPTEQAVLEGARQDYINRSQSNIETEIRGSAGFAGRNFETNNADRDWLRQEIVNKLLQERLNLLRAEVELQQPHWWDRFKTAWRKHTIARFVVGAGLIGGSFIFGATPLGLTLLGTRAVVFGISGMISGMVASEGIWEMIRNRLGATRTQTVRGMSLAKTEQYLAAHGALGTYAKPGYGAVPPVPAGPGIPAPGGPAVTPEIQAIYGDPGMRRLRYRENMAQQLTDLHRRYLDDELRQLIDQVSADAAIPAANKNTVVLQRAVERAIQRERELMVKTEERIKKVRVNDIIKKLSSVAIGALIGGIIYYIGMPKAAEQPPEPPIPPPKPLEPPPPPLDDTPRPPPIEYPPPSDPDSGNILYHTGVTEPTPIPDNDLPSPDDIAKVTPVPQPPEPIPYVPGKIILKIPEHGIPGDADPGLYQVLKYKLGLSQDQLQDLITKDHVLTSIKDTSGNEFVTDISKRPHFTDSLGVYRTGPHFRDGDAVFVPQRIFEAIKRITGMDNTEIIDRLKR